MAASNCVYDSERSEKSCVLLTGFPGLGYIMMALSAGEWHIWNLVSILMAFAKPKGDSREAGSRSASVLRSLEVSGGIARSEDVAANSG